MGAILRLEAPARNAETRNIIAQFQADFDSTSGKAPVELIVKAMKIVRERLDLLKVRACNTNLVLTMRKCTGLLCNKPLLLARIAEP